MGLLHDPAFLLLVGFAVAMGGMIAIGVVIHKVFNLFI